VAVRVVSEAPTTVVTTVVVEAVDGPDAFGVGTLIVGLLHERGSGCIRHGSCGPGGWARAMAAVGTDAATAASPSPAVYRRILVLIMVLSPSPVTVHVV
jgi:hypothetical protein